ncbi:MAG: NUDIX domain-containing protein [Bacteroidota bacterium]|nr:NUDIX domain-containing protein [Bacteroidota bacterium]
MAKKSAGLLLFRLHADVWEVLLVHPGGPFWAHKEAGAWSIPKGEFDENEDALDAAIRETEEEIGLKATGPYIALIPVKIKSGKIIHTWAVRSDFDLTLFNSNNFEMEWPPKSGVMKSFPEVDKVRWMNIHLALEKINSG